MARASQLSGFLDAELDGLPLSGEVEEEPVEEGVNPRDFVVFTGNGEPEFEYQYGCLALESGEETAVIAIATLENKLLVAVPESVWHRNTARRKLPARSLIRPALVAVAGCQIGTRTEEAHIIEQIKIWTGFLDPKVEVGLDFVSQLIPTWRFGEKDGEELVPYAPALIEVAQENYAFMTAESQAPIVEPPKPRGEERIDQLESTLLQLKSTIDKLVVGQQRPRPKPAPAPREGATQPPRTIAGLDESTVQSALAAGIPLNHLQEMGNILKQKPKRLEDLPRAPVAKPRGPLDESDPEEEEEGADDPTSGGGGTADQHVAQALRQLTKIAQKLTEPKEKKDWLDTVPDGGSGAASSSSDISGPSARRNAAAVRALQKSLTERPTQVYQAIEANLQSDYLARPISPGEPFGGGTTTRGWLVNRSRLQQYVNHVRWSWQVCGIWDALIASKPEEARARCAVLIAASDQSAIDGGNWLLASSLLLEPPPPYQSFALHQPPTIQELQHTTLVEGRWIEVLLGHLKEVEGFIESKRKLGGKPNPTKLKDEEDAAKAKAKAKSKAERERARRRGEGAGADSTSTAGT